MATDSSRSDIASMLSLVDIPIKLRCASCNNLVKDAFRLPCCDQNVCDTCQLSLPEACPICMHNPLSADDCKPNKALRLTVKAFLKSEEKKRDKERGRIEAEGAPAGVSSDRLVAQATPSRHLALKGNSDNSNVKVSETDAGVVQGLNGQPEMTKEVETVEEDSATPSSRSSSVEITLEAPTDARERGFGRASFGCTDDTSDLPGRTSGVESSRTMQAEGPQVGQSPEGSEDQLPRPAMDLGTGVAVQGGGGNMGNLGSWSNLGGFHPMMGGGTNPAMWASFQQMMSMSGMMPGMPMEPMMMQGMFGGFGGQGMGTHGMNTGIGFDGGYPSWNMGMSSDFGPNAGYYPTGGYNQPSHQGHFNQMQNAHFPNDHFNQSRLRGQGYRRGSNRDQRHFSGRSFNNQFAQTQNELDFDRGRPQQQSPRTVTQDTEIGAQNESNNLTGSTVTNHSTGIANLHVETDASNGGYSQQAEDKQGHLSTPMPLPTRAVVEVAKSLGASSQASQQSQSHAMTELEGPRRIADLDDSEDHSLDVKFGPQQQEPLGKTAAPPRTATHGNATPNSDSGFRGSQSGHPYMRGNHEARGTFKSRGSGFTTNNTSQQNHESTSSFPTSDLTGPGVSGAPTGPKAMRDGVSTAGFRGRGGFQIPGRVSKTLAATSAVGTAVKSDSMDGQQAISRRSARSASPSDSHRHRHGHRSRSTSADRDARDRERGKERKHRHSRRHSRDRTPRSALDSPDRSSRDQRKHRSSRHDRDSSRDRRKRRHRSRSPVTARAGDGGDGTRAESKADSAGHEREADSAGDRRRPHRERSPQDATDGGSRRPDTSSRSEKRKDQEKSTKDAPREFKIKDRSKKTEPGIQRDHLKEENSGIDTHNLEREVRNRERLLKEQQRRESLTAGSERKRSRAAMEDLPSPSLGSGDADNKSSRRKTKHEESSSRRHRKLSYKYEGEENEEARQQRIEVEREAARWG